MRSNLGTFASRLASSCAHHLFESDGKLQTNFVHVPGDNERGGSEGEDDVDERELDSRLLLLIIPAVGVGLAVEQAVAPERLEPRSVLSMC